MMKVFPIAEMGIAEAGVTALFGYAVVFAGLLILMALLYIMAAIFKAKAKKSENAAVSSKSAPAAAPKKTVSAPLAPGSAGGVKLFDVPEKEAAMVMAVVAYKMQKPLNELRFISIKEVKNDEV